MVRVYFQVADGLPNLLEERGIRRRIFERCQLLICRGGEIDFSVHSLPLGGPDKRAAINTLTFSRLPKALLHAGQSLRVLVKPHLRGRNGLYRIENQLAQGIPVDVKSRGATESFSQRQALLRIWLRELRDQLEIGVFDDGGSEHKARIIQVGT